MTRWYAIYRIKSREHRSPWFTNKVRAVRAPAGIARMEFGGGPT